MTNDREPSLWDLLGLDPQATVSPLPDDAWARAVRIATDPDTPPAGADLIPADDPDDLDIDPMVVDVDLDADEDVPDLQGHHESTFDPEDTAFDDAATGDLDEPYAHPEPGYPGDPDLA
ncbi:hypothetical protein M1M07_29120 [Rhodococcus sp. HM1]|uniref:hypothetical protein n=1 Tax=unclassified Rhodococcus (in: high G+C Gram-positive bacteria) TaxID=192944 RepID=UPI0018CF3E44|nr:MULTISPECIES: hypothetical protein [unclassified Rhodococcus (in: high G+C Gram-positive bacteria)]MBH0123242.1 hypothetical protein [Rhodococcus sp. CX]MCK8675156.1 hypothetical protein [Rhodococcus sp. HM1]